MRRQEYLAAIALTTGAGLAGCTSQGTEDEAANDSAGNDSAGDDNADTEADKEDAETGAAEAAGEEEIHISDDELSVDEDEYSSTSYVSAVVTNEGDSASGPITLTAQWHGENGDFLSSDSEYLATLEAGETWLARVEALAVDEEINDYELSSEVDEYRIESPDEIELVESELQTGEDEVNVTGRAKNNTGDEVGYIEAIARVYDDEERILTDRRTNETDLPEGETWKFTIDQITFSRVDDVADHDVLLTT